MPLTPQESLVLYRPQTRRRQALKSFSAQQLVLFELLRCNFTGEAAVILTL
jgi:hypothetical protein